MKQTFKKIALASLIIISGTLNSFAQDAEKKQIGTYILEGSIAGLATGGLTGVVIGVIQSVSTTSDDFGYYIEGKDIPDHPSMGERVLKNSLIGAGLGGLVGCGIGMMIPKYEKIQITPIVDPTKNNLNLGANLKVSF